MLRTMALVLLTLALAACSSLPGMPAPPDEPIVVAPQPLPVEPIDPGPPVVQPEPGIIDPRPQAWDSIEVGPDGRTLTVRWYGGVPDCYGLAEVRVERVAGVVTVTIFEGTRPQAAGQACIELAMLKSTTVILDEPILGGGVPTQ
jgi:hypothetical protein